MIMFLKQSIHFKNIHLKQFFKHALQIDISVVDAAGQPSAGSSGAASACVGRFVWAIASVRAWALALIDRRICLHGGRRMRLSR